MLAHSPQHCWFHQLQQLQCEWRATDRSAVHPRPAGWPAKPARLRQFPPDASASTTPNVAARAIQIAISSPTATYASLPQKRRYPAGTAPEAPCTQPPEAGCGIAQSAPCRRAQQSPHRAPSANIRINSFPRHSKLIPASPTPSSLPIPHARVLASGGRFLYGNYTQTYLSYRNGNPLLLDLFRENSPNLLKIHPTRNSLQILRSLWRTRPLKPPVLSLSERAFHTPSPLCTGHFLLPVGGVGNK